MGNLNAEQLKRFTETALLRTVGEPLFRWAIPLHDTISHFQVTLVNLSDDRDAVFKFQDSDSDPAAENTVVIGIPQTGGSIPEDATKSPDGVIHVETFGGFNTTFTDIAVTKVTEAGGTTTNITVKPRATVVVSFSTKKHYVQGTAVSANNARIHILARSTAMVANSSKDLARDNSSLR